MQQDAPFVAEGLVRRAIEQAAGPVSRLRHIRTKSRRSVYEAELVARREVILKLDDGSDGEDFRLALEAWALGQAADIGMPVPGILGSDFTKALMPFRYVLLEKAAGLPLSDPAMPPSALATALRAAGRWLARLHLIPVDGYGTLDERRFLDTGAVSGSFARWAVPSTLRAEAALNYLYAGGVLDVEEAAASMHLIEAEAANTEPPSRLLHGGLSPERIYAHPQSGALLGVIGFGGRMGGDPLWDLAQVWLHSSGYPGLEDAAAGFLAGYKAESGEPLPHSRFAAACLMRLLILIRSLHEQGAVSEIPPSRMRLDLLLEDAGLL